VIIQYKISDAVKFHAQLQYIMKWW